MTPETRDPRVDELRQQLRSLGYLDAGVDRFVLGPASGTRGPVALAIRSGIRVGVLAGSLLGPCAAIGLSGRLPGLVSGVRDAAVLAIYFGALFFVAFAALATLLSLAGALLARRRDRAFAHRASRVSRGAAWLVSAACLAYLTLWWRTANAGFGWSAPLWTTIALATAVTVSLLLGHAVRIATLAVLAAAAGPLSPLPREGRRSWTFMIAGGALAFLGAAALLVWTAPTEAEEPAIQPSLTVVSTGIRVRVVAIDGFDADAYRQALPAGRLSSLLRGASGVRAALRSQDTSDPASAWTTIATGVPPDAHGVHSIETRRIAGVQGVVAARDNTIGRVLRAGTDLIRLTRPSVASRDERRVKTMWEVAAEAGLRTAVINWWATWPAPSNSGIVITDRAPLRLERGGALDAEIAPADLYPMLRQAWPSVRQRARDIAARSFAQITDTELAATLRRSAELDASLVGLMETLPGPPRDLDVIYLPGLDIAQHALFAGTEGAGLPASAVSARIDALRGYYRFLDDALSQLLTAYDRETVILVTQPGRVRTSAGGFLGISARGFFVEYKTGITPEADVLDVMPTVMAALGVPLSRELTGKPLYAPPNLRFVDTYGRPRPVAVRREGQPLDQEMIDRLRSLGYVK